MYVSNLMYCVALLASIRRANTYTDAFCNAEGVVHISHVRIVASSLLDLYPRGFVKILFVTSLMQPERTVCVVPLRAHTMGGKLQRDNDL